MESTKPITIKEVTSKVLYNLLDVLKGSGDSRFARLASGVLDELNLKGLDGIAKIEAELETRREEAKRAPYPWCMGHPTVYDCVAAGYCRRDPNCGE